MAFQEWILVISSNIWSQRQLGKYEQEPRFMQYLLSIFNNLWHNGLASGVNDWPSCEADTMWRAEWLHIVFGGHGSKRKEEKCDLSWYFDGRSWQLEPAINDKSYLAGVQPLPICLSSGVHSTSQWKALPVDARGTVITEFHIFEVDAQETVDLGQSSSNSEWSVHF